MTSGPGKGGPVPPGAPSGGPVTLAVVVKGYPRLSETFIAQEILALQERGVDLAIWSLRRPTDARRHALHDRITAPVHYLPEYLRDEPGRVLRALGRLLVRHPAGLARTARGSEEVSMRLTRCSHSRSSGSSPSSRNSGPTVAARPRMARRRDAAPLPLSAS